MQHGSLANLLAATREAFDGEVDVRLGLESDFYPGVEPWLEKLHARVPLHHVLGSVHTWSYRYDDSVTHMLSLAFVASYDGGEVVPGDDMAGSEVRWASLEEVRSLPSLIPNSRPSLVRTRP